MDQIITINSRKFDSSIHRSWSCKLIEKSNSLLVFVGEFEKEVNHKQLGVIRRGTISYEYYWTDRWYNIFRFHEPEGELRNFYCNVNMPPVFEDGVLDYVDLEIDILVWSDLSFEILDTDEFEENAKIFSYSDELKSKVYESVSELKTMIEKREFPFASIQ